MFDLILRYMEKLSYKSYLITVGAMILIILLVIVVPLFGKKVTQLRLRKLGFRTFNYYEYVQNFN